jgi:hypothetical protein
MADEPRSDTTHIVVGADGSEPSKVRVAVGMKQAKLIGGVVELRTGARVRLSEALRPGLTWALQLRT